MAAVVRRTFVLGGSGDGSGAPSSATASQSSLVSPGALQAQWRVPSLLQLCADALAAAPLLTATPVQELDSLPPELLSLVCASASRRRQWSAESVRHALPLLAHVEELSLAQCDFLRGDLLGEVAAATRREMHAVDLSRSYHLSDWDGLLRAQLQRCRTLDLDRCRRLTSEQLRPLLRACPQLETLRLSGTQIDDSTLHELAQLSRQGHASGSGDHTRLTALDVSSCRMDSRLDMLSAAGLPIADLRISGCGFRVPQLNALAQLSGSLTTLHMQFLMHSRNECLAAIGACTHLTELDLSRNSELGDEGFAHLTQLTQLRSLNLSRTDLTRDSVDVLSRFSRLTCLDVGYNLGFDDSMLRALCPRLPRLRVLILAYCGVSDAGVVDALLGGSDDEAREGEAASQPLACRSIQVLKLNGCPRVGDATMQALALRAAAPLQRLDGEDAEAPLHSPSLDSPSALDSLPPLESSLYSSAPLHAFPHSLLSLDFGGPAAGDSCVSSLGVLLQACPVLQRVGVWNSQINTARLKRELAIWPPIAAGAGSDAPPGSLSHWLLDESMKTTAGTFLFVRRALAPTQPPVDQPFLYDLDAFVERAAQRRRLDQQARGKSVQFAPAESLCTYHDPPPSPLSASEDQQPPDDQAPSEAHDACPSASHAESTAAEEEVAAGHSQPSAQHTVLAD